MGLPFTGHHGGQILFGPADGHLCFMIGNHFANVGKDTKGDSELHAFLSNPAIINGSIDILSASLNREVL